MARARGAINRQGEEKLNKNKNPTWASALKSIPFFAGITDEGLEDVRNSCRLQNYRSGERIIERGQKDKDVFFLLEGSAHVLNFSLSGKTVSYGALEGGNFFGELAAIDGLPRSATVVAKTDCSTAILTADRFIHFLTIFPDCLLALIKKHASIIRAGNERIFDFALLDAEQRICLELLRLAEPDAAIPDRFAVFPVPTQENIATNVGVSRETVARLFSRLSTEKVIRRHGKTLYIENPGHLETLALS